MSFVSYLTKDDREISRVYCIGVLVAALIGIGIMITPRENVICIIGNVWALTPMRDSLASMRPAQCKGLQYHPGPTFIKPDQLYPWIKDQIKITLLPTISHLLLPNFVSCGRACPCHMTQNLVTVGAELWTAERFLVDPWSMDYADPVW